MPSTPIHEDVHGYLVESRRQVVLALEGLDDYQVRHPMTATGTNLLGVVKHLIGIEAGYLGHCLDRPFAERLPWIDNEDAPANADMWATADESREHLLELYRRACRHADAVLDEVGLDSPAVVPWWPEDRRRSSSGALLARVLKDTAMHAGQLQVLRELIDQTAGADRAAIGDDRWWADYCARLERVALEFAAGAEPSS